jgi:hypothetical protein
LATQSVPKKIQLAAQMRANPGLIIAAKASVFTPMLPDPMSQRRAPWFAARRFPKPKCFANANNVGYKARPGNAWLSK